MSVIEVPLLAHQSVKIVIVAEEIEARHQTDA